MTDVTLLPIKSGYNLQKINDNFDIISTNINTTSIQAVGGNNVMSQDLDMDSGRILNLGVPLTDVEPLRRGDITSDETGATIQYVDDSIEGFAVNDLSQTYNCTLAEYKSLAFELPVDKIVYLTDRGAYFTVVTGTGDGNNIDIIASDNANQSISIIVESKMTWGQFGATYSGADESAIVQRACEVAKHIVGKGRESDFIGVSSMIVTTQNIEIEKSHFKALDVIDSIFDCPSIVNIHGNRFDCNSLAESYIRTRDNCRVINNSISNVSSSSNNLAAGIYSTLTNKNKGIVIIRDNDIDSVIHTNTGGVIGSNDGSSRAIVVKLFGTCSRCFTAIEGNICLDIYSREGDSIATSDENWAGNNLFSVEDNNILGFNRRGIKIQSSNTTVHDNNIEDIVSTDSRAINGKNSIEIASNSSFKVYISNNTIDCLSLEGAVNIYQAVDSSVADNTINVSRTDLSGKTSVAIQYGENVSCTINNNEITTNHFIVMVDAGTASSEQGTTVRDNEITSTSLVGVVAASATIINITGSESRGVVRGNNVKGDVESLVAATGGKILTNYRVMGNDIVTTAGKGRIVDASGATHINCLASNNTTDGTNQPFPTPLVGFNRYGNYHPTFTTGVNNQDLLVERGSAIADSTGGDNQATINLILAELRIKNIIAP